MKFLSSERVLCVAVVLAAGWKRGVDVQPVEQGRFLALSFAVVRLPVQGQLWGRIGLLSKEWNLSTPPKEIPQLISVPLGCVSSLIPQKPNRPCHRSNGCHCKQYVLEIPE